MNALFQGSFCSENTLFQGSFDKKRRRYDRFSDKRGVAHPFQLLLSQWDDFTFDDLVDFANLHDAIFLDENGAFIRHGTYGKRHGKLFNLLQ